MLNLQLTRAYLTATYPAYTVRTWQRVMNEIQTHGRESTQTPYVRAMQSPADNNGIRDKKLLETTAEDLLAIMKSKKGVGGGAQSPALAQFGFKSRLAASPDTRTEVMAKPQQKARRGITLAEQRILEAEKNAERSLFYRLLWENRHANYNETLALASIFVLVRLQFQPS